MMDPSPPAPPTYNPHNFLDRAVPLQIIINTFMQPGPQHRRSIIVEGPSGQGKSWLLKRVIDEFRTQYSTEPIAICYLEATDFQPLPGDGTNLNNLTYSLLARVWEAAHTTFPALPWPAPPLTPVPHPDIVQFLQSHTPTHWFDLIFRELSMRPDPCCLLIICDAMEEIDSQHLEKFELEVLRPLFVHVQVYLLAARRIKSQTHRWRKFDIKQETIFLDLKPFDRADTTMQLTALAPGYTLNAGQPFPGCQYYTGGNPRANAFLAGRLIANQGHLTSTDFRNCLNELMLFHGQQLSQPHVNWLERSIKQFHPTISDPGVQTYELNSILGGIPDAERDTFLEQLQNHGIGQFTAGGWFFVFQDFVELFREL